jgi:hypothetical protein
LCIARDISEQWLAGDFDETNVLPFVCTFEPLKYPVRGLPPNPRPIYDISRLVGGRSIDDDLVRVENAKEGPLLGLRR